MSVNKKLVKKKAIKQPMNIDLTDRSAATPRPNKVIMTSENDYFSPRTTPRNAKRKDVFNPDTTINSQ